MADENQLAPGRQTRLTADDESPNQLFLGDPEAAAAVASSQAMAPIVGPYLRDVFTGQMAKRSLMEMFPPTPDWDPNKSALENARDQLWNPLTGRAEISPTAMDLALAFSGGGLHFRAYHGSKAKFQEFLDQYMSTGEGGQAFSWGHYVGQHPGTGEAYQRSVGGHNKVPEHPTTGDPLLGADLAEMYYKPGTIVPTGSGTHVRVRRFDRDARDPSQWQAEVNEVLPGPAPSGRYTTGIDLPENWINSGQPFTYNRMPDANNIERVGRARGWTMRDPGYFYDVWVKPEHHEFLDWFKPFHEQEPAVRDKLRPIMQNMGVDPYGPTPRSPNMRNPQEMTGRDIYSMMTQWNAPTEPARTGRNMTREEWKAAQKRASKQLDSLGIPGMRFWDEGSRYLPDISMDFGGRIPKELHNTPLMAGGWFSQQMQKATSYRNLKDRVWQRYQDAILHQDTIARSYMHDEAQITKHVAETTKDHKNLFDFVVNNEKDFKEVPTKKTYNYVIYDPKNLEITHRDGRKLIPVDDDPIFPERTKAYKPR